MRKVPNPAQLALPTGSPSFSHDSRGSTVNHSKTNSPMTLQITKQIFGGRALCARCQAHSKRTGQQCNAAAMAGKRVCATHGGKSTGSRTVEGKARQIAANTKTGEYAKVFAKARSAKLKKLAYLQRLVQAAVGF